MYVEAFYTVVGCISITEAMTSSISGNGTLLSSIVKDAVPRFWTMKGKRVERIWGWDCHGLPAEVFTEKKLNIQDKRDIGTKNQLRGVYNYLSRQHG